MLICIYCSPCCQVSSDSAKLAHRQLDTVPEHAQLEKLERLEQEYLRLTRTQNIAEVHMKTEYHAKLKNDIRTFTDLTCKKISVFNYSLCFQYNNNDRVCLNMSDEDS